jgi:hypothetical protein
MLEGLLASAKRELAADKYRAFTRDSEFYRGAVYAGEKYIRGIEYAIQLRDRAKEEAA